MLHNAFYFTGHPRPKSMPQQKSHHKSVFTSQPKGDRETEHQDHRNRMQYWALPSSPFFLSSVAFLCCKKKKTKEFCPNLFLLMLTLSWDILICPVHIWTSAHPIWVFHWKKNLTCSRGICWFVREQSNLVKRLKGQFQRQMRYVEWFLLDASILHLVTINQCHNELNPFHEHMG